MKAQYDGRTRIVALPNLVAMAERVSGTCHRYTVEEPSPDAKWVKVWYSNPNEYGAESPFYRRFPIVGTVGGTVGTTPTPLVGIGSIVAGPCVGEPKDLHGEGWQCFDCLTDCPELYRNPRTRKWEVMPQPEGKPADWASRARELCLALAGEEVSDSGATVRSNCYALADRLEWLAKYLRADARSGPTTAAREDLGVVCAALVGSE